MTGRGDQESPSLRPLAGSARAIEDLVRRWLDSDGDPLWVRTSGSTGRPKDVMLSASAVVASARATLARIGGAGGWVLALPASYVAGLQVIVRSVLAGTSPVVLSESGLGAAVDALRSSDRRYSAIVPTQLHRWLQDPRATRALADLDAVLLGGAAAPPRLVDEARARGITVVTTYGMTETCGGCVYDGTPLDGVTVSPETDGRITIAGPILFDGYAGDPELTSTVLRDGWFSTPDAGRLDADGRLHVLGRVDDVVVTGGVNVPLGVVERAISALPGIAQCAVIARDDPEWGARVVAVVVPAGDAPSLAAIRDAVAESCPRTWAPRELVVVDRIPLLANGKFDRVALATTDSPSALPGNGAPHGVAGIGGTNRG